MARKVVFSGIQPSGKLHIGNYLGAIKQWARQEAGTNIFCVVDMHAVTVEQDPDELREATLVTVAQFIAAGVDTRSILFVQSHNPDHTSLAWIMNTVISMGQMGRMTQYKEKSDKKDFVSVGLFDYPALMAADILLYDTTHVPVGDDQKQHVELARDAAGRFNSRFGETFVLPSADIGKTGARIMSLSDPTKKMSKSDPSALSRVELLDSPETIKKKIASAITDSEDRVEYSKEKPGISNLIEIYAGFSEKSTEEIEQEFDGKNYDEFKNSVTQSVVSALSPIQRKYEEIRKDSSQLDEVLTDGAQKAHEISSKKLQQVYDKVGFIRWKNPQRPQ